MVIVGKLLVFVCVITQTTEQHQFKPIFWTVKPYIFWEDGILQGIIVDILKAFTSFCSMGKFKGLNISEKNDFKENYTHFLNVMQSNFTKLNNFKNLSHEEIKSAWWAPVLSPTVHLKEKNFVIRNLAISPGAYVIVPRDMISFPNKVWYGMGRIKNEIIFIVLHSISIGIIVWLIERWFNPDFNKQFPFGAFDGMWWAIVTMTTVGYGDLVPRHYLSRLVSFVWMLYALITFALMTATVTDAISGVNIINIQKKKVAVLKGSWEEKIANDYKSVVVGKDSYTEVVNALRTKVVFAALINSDVVSWMQDEIGNKDPVLSIVYEIKQAIPIRVAEYFDSGTPKRMEQFFACQRQYYNEIYSEALLKYHKVVQVETTYYPSTKELMEQRTGLYSLYLVFGLILLSIVLELTLILYRKRKQKALFPTRTVYTTWKEDIKTIKHELLRLKSQQRSHANLSNGVLNNFTFHDEELITNNICLNSPTSNVMELKREISIINKKVNEISSEIRKLCYKT